MKSDFLIALTQLAAERHLPREQVLQAIEVALASAFKKDNPASGQNISVKLNPNTGEVSVYALKTVVQEVEDSDREISVADAKYIKNGVDLGDEVAAEEPLPHNASRIAAQNRQAGGPATPAGSRTRTPLPGVLAARRGHHFGRH